MPDNNCTNKKKWLDTCGTLFNLLLAICGTATAIFAYHASLNANEISRRSIENEEQSAQPIITGYINNDTLFMNIQKDFRGINFVNAIPIITLREGLLGKEFFGSKKIANLTFKSKRIGSNCNMDESNNIQCSNREFKDFISTLNNKLNFPNNSTPKPHAKFNIAYLFTISYNDIYNKRQIQHFIVSKRGRQHQINDSLFKEKFAHTEYLTMADTTAEGINRILSKLSQAEDKSSKANSF